MDDNQIVVLGGLIQDSVNDVASKTPLLGDIPLLGNLFRYETRQHTKTNLMVFIRPYIMYQSDGYRKITDERYDQMSKRREDARIARSPDPAERRQGQSAAAQAGETGPGRLLLPAPPQRIDSSTSFSSRDPDRRSIAAPPAACPTPSPRRRAWC